MQTALDESQAAAMRKMAADVSAAVEARIRGEVGSGERVRRAAQQVEIAGMSAPEYWGSQLWQPLKSICLVMAQEMGVLPCINEAVDKKGKKEISAEEVASEVKADTLLIARLMRVLTAVGICDETGPNKYRPNDLSRIAASLGGRAGVKITNELLFPIAAQIIPYMRQHGFKQFPRRSEGELDVTQFTFGGKMMWEYFKENAELKGWFDTLMAENRANNMPWFHIYPFAQELGQSCSSPEEVLLVDVGGNRGADIVELSQAHPEMKGRLILQDLPETISMVDKNFAKGIELQPYDFFTEQPVKGAKAYFWRWILHDWDDESVRRFMANTVEAMGEDSRILLEELVLPDEGVDMKGSHLDILMMLYHSGMERSLSQWRALVESCGLEIVKVWSRPDTDPSILECRKKKV